MSAPAPAARQAAARTPVVGSRAGVVGGGLAGIAAALRLAEAGVRVTLLESRRELGGVAGSLRRGDLVADTGQHVFLRCYTAYRQLLDALGVTGLTDLQERFALTVLSPGRRPARLVRDGLPAPLHLLRALAGYRMLTRRERCAALRAAAALRTVDPDDPATDEVGFGDWLAAHGQSRQATSVLWDLFTVPALNLPSRAAPLGLAARVFRTGLLDSPDAADIGRSRVPLRELHCDAARSVLTGLGVQVCTGVRVRWVEARAGGFTAHAEGAGYDAEALVLAVPHRSAAAVVPPGAVAGSDSWWRLGSAPIVNVHLRYDRVVTGLPFAAVVGCPVQWVFDAPAVAGESGQHLVVPYSAAWRELATPARDLIGECLQVLAEVLPAARAARLRDAFVTRERHATFRAAPGTRAWRPTSATALPGLALAGAWTDTGWPDTMEGAVRSGFRAAEVALEHLSMAPRSRQPRSPSRRTVP